MKNLILKIIVVTVVFVFSSCGGSGKSGINGVFTFSEFDNLFDKHTGVMSFEIDDGEVQKGRKIVSGRYPRKHSEGKITFREGCGANADRISIIDTDGLITPITPCVNTLGLRIPHYGYSKLSPDASLLAVEVSQYMGYGAVDEEIYLTIVFDLEGKEIIRYEGFAAPEWLSDHKLLLAGTGVDHFGLYVTDDDLKNPSKIDNDKLKSFTNNPAVSPSGDQVVFQYNQQIWIMDMDGDNLGPLIVSGMNLTNPTWSPDGDYLAYLAVDASANYYKAIYFYEFDSKETHMIDTNEIFAHNVYNSFPDPTGPLSWTETP